MRGLAFGLVVMIECARTPYEYGSSGTDGTTSTGAEAESTAGDSTSSDPSADSTSDSSDSSSTGPEALACDIAAQDCPPGEKCTYRSSGGSSIDGRHCVTIAEDPAGLGEPCTVESGPLSGFDDCALRMMCLLVDPETLTGRCLQLCTGGTVAECPDEYQCLVSSGGNYPGTCRLTCDPLSNACEANEACTPYSESFLCIPVVQPPIPAGGACEFANVCESGTFCANPEIVSVCDEEVVAGCCVPFCNVDDPGTTCETFDPTTSCLPWWSDGTAPPEHAHVGLCALPEQ